MRRRDSRGWRRWVVPLLGLSLLGSPASSAGGEPQGRSLLDRALAGALSDVREIVFCTRLRYNDGHWYANIGYYCDDETRDAFAGNGRPDEGRLLALDVRSGEARTILEDPGGSIRDPQIHYDAKKILFSYRPAGTRHYNLYEIGLDGEGLRQLTSGDFDDYEPCYLPDGSIIFVSTRCNRWVNCWMTQVGVLYRCDEDGGNIRLVSANTEHDNTPWVLPDGRILYTRWEYVDRSQVEFHHLWTMNPDGTGQMVYYGNMRPRIVMIDAKPIAGTDKIVASFSPGHGVNEHAGTATVVSAAAGPDALSSAKPLHRGKLTRDPYAISEDTFIVARDRQIVLMHASGEEQVIHDYRGEGHVHEPRPVRPRARERVIPDRADPSAAGGVMVLADVYASRNLEGVERGEIKKLLVLESLPKPVNFSGGPDLLSWLGTFTLERVLGTVPVEEDGSAHFEVPAYRQIFFVALDENDLSVKRMQSFTCAMPGETVGCAGCHEERTLTTPASRRGVRLAALERPPSPIRPFTGLPDVLDFQRDIQPILDRHCIRCHGYEKREGRVILEGDLGPQWSHAFFSLFAHRQVADGRNGLGNQPPRTIGSSASALLDKVDGSHHGVEVSRGEWRTLWLWIESGAPFAGSYAGLRNREQQARAGMALGRVFGGAGEVLGRRCRSCHGAAGAVGVPLPYNPDFQKRNRSDDRPRGIHERNIYENDPVARFSPNIIVNFTRPELSTLLLGPLAAEAGGFGSCGRVFADKADPDYEKLLAALRAGKEMIDAEPRYGTPGFRPNRQYVRELEKYGILSGRGAPPAEEIDVFAADQKYWESFWHRGAADVEARSGSGGAAASGSD